MTTITNLNFCPLTSDQCRPATTSAFCHERRTACVRRRTEVQKEQNKHVFCRYTSSCAFPWLQVYGTLQKRNWGYKCITLHRTSILVCRWSELTDDFRDWFEHATRHLADSSTVRSSHSCGVALTHFSFSPKLWRLGNGQKVRTLRQRCELLSLTQRVYVRMLNVRQQKCVRHKHVKLWWVECWAR